MRSMASAALFVVAIALAFSVIPGPVAAQESAQPNVEKLMKPEQLTETAPEKYKVKFDTSKGEFIVDVTRAWTPAGADRFYNLVKNGFYNNVRFFRVIEGFMVQFGINGDPKINNVLRMARIKDDPVKQSNTRGYITFAKTGEPNSRTTQVFINFGDNSRLDKDGFAPFGKVSKGMDIVDSLYAGYGGTPSDSQPRIQAEGNAFLEKTFPKLDYVKTATIMPAK
jgi:peptidyl-prolyl cis-trans isomerase A (cyclophilin A)